MTLRQFLVAFGSVCILASITAAQQTPSAPPTVQRDPQAITILTQALNAAGGTSAVVGVQDYTATANVTYYWAGEQVEGTAVLKGRGTGQFRVDATLPDGMRCWDFNNGTGFFRDVDGTVRIVPYQNAVNFGNLAFPVGRLAAVLQDLSASITYVGLETRGGGQVQHLRIQEVFTGDVDPHGTYSKLTIRDFFIDPTTFQIVGTADMIHPDNAVTINLTHEMQFSNFQTVNGILVPFSIVEIRGGQQTYAVQLNQVTFNTGLQNLDFEQ